MTTRLSLFAFLALLVSLNANGQGFPPPEVEVVAAEVRALAPTTEVPGSVISLNDARIAAEVEGPLVWVAQVGTAVARGDAVARIDTRLLALAVRTAKARVARLEADLVLRTQNLARMNALRAQDNASQARLDEATAASATTAQDLEEARAQLVRVEGDLERATIKAPYAGHVTERLAQVGEFIARGNDVVRLVDTADIEVALPAPLRVIRYVAQGQNLTVVRGDRLDTLPVRTVVPVGDASSRVAEVRLSADPQNFLIGEAVRVHLPTAMVEESVVIPRDTIVVRGGTRYVFRVKDGIAEQIKLDIKTLTEGWIAVENGIETGDQLVLRGGGRLTDGQTVKVKAATP